MFQRQVARSRGFSQIAIILALSILSVLSSTSPGQCDILFQNKQTGQLDNWQMNGASRINSGFLTNPRVPGWKVVGAADFNSDGSPDILFQNQQTGQLVYWIMLRTVFDHYGFLLNPGSPDWKVVGISDLNGDLKADLLIQNRQS